jgi:hypothetical protein
MTQPNVIGKIITELRSASAVAAITDRIRSPEPAPGDSGWSENPSTHVRTFENAFVVLVPNGGGWLPNATLVPVRSERIVARCYGRTSTEAESLYRACSAAIHGIGPRTYATGLAIYQSFDAAGPDYDADPDTHQPHYDFVIEVLASAQAVA